MVFFESNPNGIGFREAVTTAARDKNLHDNFPLADDLRRDASGWMRKHKSGSGNDCCILDPCVMGGLA
jgi:hypothetical protein